MKNKKLIEACMKRMNENTGLEPGVIFVLFTYTGPRSSISDSNKKIVGLTFDEDLAKEWASAESKNGKGYGYDEIEGDVVKSSELVSILHYYNR